MRSLLTHTAVSYGLLLDQWTVHGTYIPTKRSSSCTIPTRCETTSKIHASPKPLRTRISSSCCTYGCCHKHQCAPRASTICSTGDSDNHPFSPENFTTLERNWLSSPFRLWLAGEVKITYYTHTSYMRRDNGACMRAAFKHKGKKSKTQHKRIERTYLQEAHPQQLLLP